VEKPASLPPELTPDLANFYPTTLLVTGFDILFFWVARMIMLGCHFTLDVPMPNGTKRDLANAVPFKEVYIHGLVRDANRVKMSKTKGNVINPIDIIERFGTDAVRFTLASMASPGTDIAFSEARTEGYRAFANKIWNAARFLFMNLDRARESNIPFDLPAQSPGAPSLRSKGGKDEVAAPTELDPVAFDHSITGKIAKVVASIAPEGEAALQTGNPDTANPSVGVPMAASDTQTGAPHLASEMWDGGSAPLESRWILARLSETAAAVNNSLNDYRFDEAASHVYQFFWGDICDWYLEIVKLRLNFDDAAQHAQTTAALTTLVRVFESALRLLSPFMPFLTEEIWHALYSGHAPSKSIALTRYPQPQDYPADPAAIRDMSILQNLITTVRGIRKELGVPEKEATPVRIHAAGPVAALAEANSNMLARLARVSAVEIAPAALTGTSARSTSAFDVAVLYERHIDVTAERERLTKEFTKLDKQITANQARLADPKFTDKAPAHIVEGLRKQTYELRILRDKAQGGLDALPPE
jgi:valyl-tRNA synthetase